jgi:multiple sugar transport system permease protein
MRALSQSPPPFIPEGQTPVKAKKITVPAVTSNLVLGAIGIVFALPLVWLVLASVDSHASFNISLPHFTLSNFSSALSAGRGRSLVISMELAGIATLVATVTGTMAAYAFSRRHIPWKGPALLFVLFLSGVPISVIIIPVYQVFSEQGWLTVIPTAVFLGITALPFEIWIIKNFIDEVPEELEEAARVEGASTATIIRRIVVPLAAPGILAAAIYGFVLAWGSFLIPLVLITDNTQQPGAVTVYSFISAAGVNYGDIAAYSILYSLPVVILYVILGRFFTGGFRLGGAVKG